MKTLLYALLLIVLLSCNSNNKIDPRVLTVPTFSMQLVNGSGTFNTANVQKGVPTVVVFFSPDCKFSQRQTANIIANHDALKNVNIYMCSSAPMQKLHDFSDHYQLNRFSNITVGRDMNLFFEKQLEVPGYPWSFMYSADKQLKRIATGFVDAKRILNEIKG